MNKNNDFLNILRSIANHPGSSQRSLAKKIGLSLGKLNYCLKALKQKGLVKNKNFKNNKNKKYSDLMIQVRKNSHIKIIEEYLSIYKIPINKKGIYNIFKSPEIIDILKILKFIKGFFVVRL